MPKLSSIVVFHEWLSANEKKIVETKEIKRTTQAYGEQRVNISNIY